MGSNIPLLIGAAIIALVSIPLIANAAPPNRYYGFRTRQTLSDERVWYRANRFAGWAMFIASIMSATVLALVPRESPSTSVHAVGILVVPVLIAAFASYLYLRRISAE
jgi:uncharacterized membrane protein